MKTSIKIFCLTILFSGCSKGPDPAPAPAPPAPPPPVNKTCIFSGIVQRNSGGKAEFALNISYDASLNPVSIGVFDSAANTALFTATLNYVTADSIRIGQYQYMKLDASKRVAVFVTKSDLSDIPNADNYRYEYSYNSDGYLATKNLFVNGSADPMYTTNYTYTNGLLTTCVMKTGGSNGLKLLEATLSYDAVLSPKIMPYLFPDGFESWYYTAAMNFGLKPGKALSQAVTKIYNPTTAALIDTWTTNYSSYVLDGDGYISSCNASGDQQQGIAAFYGKTYFGYQCK